MRLLNTAGGPVLCLAGDVDAGAVASFRQRYGAEPVPVSAVDAGSVTALSVAGRDLLQDHLDVARRGGRQVPVRHPEPAAAAAGFRGDARPGAQPR
ncbi:hypothetical protein BD833_10354 [Blastococcus xanthinilyticus]|uniref:STAS domain-containing protein n=1 Tax=Blastococcus xanthinilyticus TaxID=1564164 RepID=A0A5S5D0W8_9ACTN|nr:hypothetical protein BD833_10354 [Blastococcus xanthinilyticus]